MLVKDLEGHACCLHRSLGAIELIRRPNKYAEFMREDARLGPVF